MKKEMKDDAYHLLWKQYRVEFSPVRIFSI